MDEFDMKLLTNTDLGTLFIHEGDIKLYDILILDIQGSQGYWQIINIFDEGIICTRCYESM